MEIRVRILSNNHPVCTNAHKKHGGKMALPPCFFCFVRWELRLSASLGSNVLRKGQKLFAARLKEHFIALAIAVFSGSSGGIKGLPVPSAASAAKRIMRTDAAVGMNVYGRGNKIRRGL